MRLDCRRNIKWLLITNSGRDAMHSLDNKQLQISLIVFPFSVATAMRVWQFFYFWTMLEMV